MNKLSKLFKFSMVVIITSFAVGIIATAQWTEPTADPPLGNVAPPVQQWQDWDAAFRVDSDADGVNEIIIPTSTPSTNSEIQISTHGNPYWAIYNDFGSGELRFWSAASDNLLRLHPSGEVEISGDMSFSNPQDILKGSAYTAGGLNLIYDAQMTNGYDTSRGWQRNGSGKVNPREVDFWDGKKVRVIEMVTSGNDWLYTPMVDIDPNKTYKFSVWVKTSSTGAGTRYFGLYAYDDKDVQGVLNSNGTLNTNPYFWSGDPTPNKWVYLESYIYPTNSPDAPAGWRMNEDGSFGGNIGAFKWRPGTNRARIRLLNYYNSGTSVTDNFYMPRITEVSEGQSIPDSRYHIGDLTVAGTVCDSNGCISSGSGVPGGVINQTLYHNGTGWAASSVLQNNGTNIGIRGIAGNASLSVWNNGSAALWAGTSAATQILVNNVGNVSIGNNNTPATLLHLFHSSSGPIVTLSGLNTNYRGITVKDTAGTEQWFYGPNDNNHFVVRRNNSTDDITVNKSTGYVGIGTTAPGAKLEVAGQVKITGGAPGANKVLTSDATGLASWQNVSALPGTSHWTQTGSYLYPNNLTWNVGIGTTNPSVKLAIEDADTGFEGQGGGNLDLMVNSQQLVRFANSQRVGIGTTLPGARLHVVDNSNQVVGLIGSTGQNTNLAIVRTDASQTAKGVRFEFNETDGLRIQSANDDGSFYPTPGTIATFRTTDGNVGIGTTGPQRKLDIGGTGHIAFLGNSVTTNSTAGLYWYSDDRYGIYRQPGAWASPYPKLQIKWATGVDIDTDGAGNHVVLAKSGGHVGIGTTNPGAKLEVNGMSMFGSGSLQLAAGENLLYGNIDQNSEPGSNLLRLQNESVDMFKVNNIGNLTLANGIIVGESALTFGSGGDIVDAVYFGIDKILTVPVKIETEKLETSYITHKEQSAGVIYLYGSSNCEKCGGILPYGPQYNLPQRLVRWFIPSEVYAAPGCYEYCNPQDAPLCSSLGPGWSEDTSERIVQNVTKQDCGISAGQCSFPATYSDYGDYIKLRKCVGPSGSLQEVTKMEFKWDEDAQANTTVIYDNLQAPDNVLESCEWRDLTVTNPQYVCPAGKFLAGYDDSRLFGDYWYCCEL